MNANILSDNYLSQEGDVFALVGLSASRKTQEL